MTPPDPSAIAAPLAPVPHRGPDAMWDCCLAITRGRRTGQRPNLARSTLVLTHAQGWQLDGPWDLQACTMFQLLKPLLDCRPEARPWVIGQLGQSLDGCIATRTGDAHFVNGPDSLAHLHRLRALADAVLVGAGTVVIDNPQLTTRRVSGPNPVRVLFDPQLQLAGFAASARVFTDRLAPTLWLCDARWQQRAAALAGTAQVLAVPGLVSVDGMADVVPALAALHARGLRVLFVEGGGVTVSRFLAQGRLDRLHLAVAPLIIGNGKPGLRFTGAARLGDCPHPPFRVVPMGHDQLWDLDLTPLRETP